MIKRLTATFAIAASICTISTSPAFAGWGKVTVTDGQGDGVQVKHYPFGQRSVVVQDQLGDTVVHKKGIFGVNRETGVSVLGTGVDYKHGLIRGNTIKGQDLLGDSFQSKKTFFGLGPRITTVDAKGMTNLVGGLLHPGPMMNMSGASSMGGFSSPQGIEHSGGFSAPQGAERQPGGGFSQYAPAKGFGEADNQAEHQTGMAAQPGLPATEANQAQYGAPPASY